MLCHVNTYVHMNTLLIIISAAEYGTHTIGNVLMVAYMRVSELSTISTVMKKKKNFTCFGSHQG